MAKSPLLPQRFGDTLIVSLDPPRLKAAREAAGLSQEALAADIEVHPQFVSQLERGKKRPAFDTVKRLAEALGCDPADICVTVPAGAA